MPALYLSALDDRNFEEEFTEVYNTYKRLVYHTLFSIIATALYLFFILIFQFSDNLSLPKFTHTPKDSQMNSLISEIHCKLSRDTIAIELLKIYIKILYMY